MKDLVVLTADKSMEHAISGLLTRHHSIGIKNIEYDLYNDPDHDPGCANRGVPFLSNFSTQYKHGLLIFDHEGSGKEDSIPAELAANLTNELNRSWGGRATAIVIVPELESWVWSSSPYLDRITGWDNQPVKLREWLSSQGWIHGNSGKPSRPKEAFEAALKVVGTPRSASLYNQLACKVSLRGCVDDSFNQLIQTLHNWFPMSPAE